MTRVSVVHYLNTAPLVWGMLHGAERNRFELGFTTPAGCADALRAGQADVGIIPSIEYQRIDHVRIVPGVSIASKRAVRSVLLLARVPLQDVRRVALDTSSRTSAALVSVLFHHFYRRPIQTHPAAPDAAEMLAGADAALLIGDPALVYRGEARAYDLAAEWRRFTGLPFVFALWAGSERVSLEAAHFQASRDHGLAHLDEIAAEWGPRLGLSHEDVKIYLARNIDYTLDEENLEGLLLFYRLAREAGLIPREKELRFVSGAAARVRSAE